MARLGAEKQLPALVQLLEAEADRGVLRAVFQRLDELQPLTARRKEWSSPALSRALLTPSGPATTRAARALAGRLGLSLAEAPAELPPVEVPLAQGESVTIATRPPVEGELSGLRGARVETTAGTFIMAFDVRSAPYAVALFVRLAEADFFDDRAWHRVIPGFVAQTGCPRGDGWGGLGLAMPDELAGAVFPAGSVGIARAEADTGGTQWFVVTSDQPHLGGDYTRLGEVTVGLEVVSQLAPWDRVIDVVIERAP
jgi:cyclophilin family peptidyl-prolyl cis-trans isomerase